MAEAGIEPYGEANGFVLMPAGSIRSLSGEPGLGVLVAVVVAVPYMAGLWWSIAEQSRSERRSSQRTAVLDDSECECRRGKERQ